jgi:DNA gyrase subunit A
MTTATPGVISGSFADEIDQNFTRYAYLTIEDRALPDARDGLKPSQRRLMVAMNDLKLRPSGPPKKCAKICGDTSGNYHPHGEGVVYPTLVRMAQSWVLRHPLATPQGNFGNIDGDPPAAMRYTEAKLSPFATLLLDDLSVDVVDYQPNYNEELQEPIILPAKIPNLLVNGVSGIAVGYATNMPPHNLGEVLDAVEAYIANPDITIDEIMGIMPGPDFPNGGKILGRAGIRDYYRDGRGSVKLEGSWEVIDKKGKQQIIIRELPYMAGPTEFLNQLVALVEAGDLNGISDARDLTSKKNGLCVQIDVAKGASAELIIATLQKRTCLRKTFSVNQTVMVDGELRESMPVLDLIKVFVEFRELCLTRKLEAERKRNLDRTEIVEGYIQAARQLDKAIKIIRESEDPEEAKRGLLGANIVKTERQADAVLAMTLRSLTKLEAKNLKEELQSLKDRKDWLDGVIGNTVETRKLISEELVDIKKKHTNERRSIIDIDPTDISEEDLIEDERVMISLSGEGYVRRIPSDEYRIQKRGGTGSRSSNKKTDDGAVEIFEGSTKDIMFFFTNRGRVFQRKAYEIPQSAKTSRGMHVSNLLDLAAEETVTNMISISEIGEDGYLVMVTRNGFIKRSRIQDYDSNRRNSGINGIKLDDGDEVAFVLPTTGDYDIFLVTEQGNAIRYSEEIIPVQGRVTRGSRALKLNPGDRVAQIFTLDPNSNPDIFVITSAGYGKKSPATEYRRLSSRNVKGYAVIKKDALQKRGGTVVGACALTGGESLLALTKMGQAVRFDQKDIRNTGRATGGVRVIRLSDGDSVLKLAKLAAAEDEDED